MAFGGGLAKDLRFAARVLRRSPAFTATAVITVALGIGATTAIFSVLNAVVLRPLPFDRPERLVHVFRMQPPVSRALVSVPTYRDLVARQRGFEVLAARQFVPLNLTGVDRAERLAGWRVTPDFFALFGARPARGRLLEPADDQPGSPAVAVISDGLWRRRFGGPAGPEVIGRRIALDGQSHTVVGVAPPALRAASAQEVDLWTPARLGASTRERGDNFLRMIGRLRDGVTVEGAMAQLDHVAAGLAREHPGNHAELTFLVAPMLADQVREVKTVLWLLLAGVLLVLLIACANVANLLLARATVRQRELAVRAALGAGRWRLAQQLLTESLLLAVVGGAVGVLAAHWGVEALLALAPPSLPRAAEVDIDGRVLAFSLGLALVTGVVFGLAPAWRLGRLGFERSLKEDGRGVAGRRVGSRLRRALVVTELALSLVLLAGAGLAFGSVRRLLAVDPGFDPGPLLAANISYPREETRAQFLRAVVERVAALPGVASVGVINDLPVTGASAMSGNFQVQGAPRVNWATAPVADKRFVTPAYFRTMGIPLRAGRTFGDRDGRPAGEGAPILINETLARRFFPGQDPLGKRLLVQGVNEIIGVVGDVRQRGLARATTPDVYFSLWQLPGTSEVSLLVRAAAGGDPAALAPAVRRAVEEVDPTAPVSRIRTMDEVVATSIGQERFTLVLLAAFALVALALAAIGLYGVMAYQVAARAREMGVRLALGAQSGDVLGLVIGQGLRLTALGVAIGLAAALGLGRLLARLFFGVQPVEPATLAAVAALLMAVALAACYLPARRATRVDPLVVLREE
jgi:putative ABC transport system permease protein